MIPDPVTTLPFVKDLPRPTARFGRRSFWAPDCRGLDYIRVCELGEDLALEAVRYMRVHQFAPLLTWAVLDMPRRRGEAQMGVQVGFLEPFGNLAVLAASPDRLASYELWAARKRAEVRRGLDGLAAAEEDGAD